MVVETVGSEPVSLIFPVTTEKIANPRFNGVNFAQKLGNSADFPRFGAFRNDGKQGIFIHYISDILLDNSGF